MQIALYAFPVLAGVLNAIHSGTNAQLTNSMGRPWWAAAFVCLVAGIAILPGVLISRETLPSMASIAGTPWWAWLGTVIAAVPVITTLLFAGRLGGAAFNGLVVTSTIVTSILLDHYGLLGFKTHLVNIWRIVGAVTMIAGLTLVCVF
ncbi:DMT family transporter [Lichenicoccus sp.]|uniref:DMT family transporter n=1 Tax=Lichenicoccus sp. TaxID=2781899 RepID=UPI003D0FBF69